MVQTVASIHLPVDEKLEIRKNRLAPLSPSGSEKRICIVTGVHGDELEGQFVCYELNRRLQEHPEWLTGIVDIYPAMNPMGIDSITRGIPMFDLDMNRIFPGNADGAVPEYIASQIIEDMKGADFVIDIHASNIFLQEIPQARISEITAETLLPYAKLLGLDFIWIHSAATVLESTLAHSLNMLDTKTIVVEMGVGMRITRAYGLRLVNGILNLMKDQGLWQGTVDPVREPIVSSDGKVGFVNADASGIFVPCVEHWKAIEAGDPMGDILDPLTGQVKQHVTAPVSGMIFTLREYPVVYSGSLLARILGGVTDA